MEKIVVDSGSQWKSYGINYYGIKKEFYWFFSDKTPDYNEFYDYRNNPRCKKIINKHRNIFQILCNFRRFYEDFLFFNT